MAGFRRGLREIARTGFTVLIAFVALQGALFAQDLKSTGLTFLEEGTYRSIPLASTPLLGNLPGSIDLSSKFPVPGNQGQQSSCVGWAVSHLKSYQEGVERKWSLSPAQHRFSPSYIYNQIRPASGCMGGSNYVDALTIVRSGSATLEEFPYDESSCSAVPSAAVKQHASQYAIADWRRVNVQDAVEVKTQVASGFPVLIGMMVDDGFMRLSGSQIYSGPSGASRGGHAMVVVGYSDSLQAYKVINSWGTNWGDNGFGWISYNAFRQTVREAYTAQDIVINKPDDTVVVPPPPPPGGATVTLGTPNVIHNVSVATPIGMQMGMQIRVPGQVTGAARKSMQVVVKFNYLNGPALLANPSEPSFRDSGGLVATGTQPIPVATDFEQTDALQIHIPYYALNFAPSGGAMTYNLSLTAIALIDNQQKTQTPPVPFIFRW